MAIPYYKECVNEDIDLEAIYDYYNTDIFTGVILPNGKLFGKKGGHRFSAAGTMIGCAISYRDLGKEKVISHFKDDIKKFVLGMNHKDKIFLIDIITFMITYNEQYFELDSPFMRKYLSMESEGATDYLVQLLNYDKVERIPKTITTSKANIYEEFFNYLIMEFNLIQIPKVAFDEKVGDFNFISSNDFIQFGKEKECEEEVRLIKKYIPLNERPRYFR